MPETQVELEAAGQLLATADAARAQAMDAVTTAVKRAVEGGMPVAHVARAVGLSRLSVYRLLERDGGS